MPIIFYYVISSLLTTIFSLSLGIFIYLRDKKNSANRNWLVMSISVAIWSIGFAGTVSGNFGHGASLLLGRVSHLGALFIPLFYLKFVLSVIDKSKKYRRSTILSSWISILLLFSIFTGYFIVDVVAKYHFKYYYVPALFYYFFTAYFILTAVYVQCLLLIEIPKSTGYRKNQLLYIFFAASLGFLGGATTFPLVYNINFPPIGGPLVFIYTLLIAYAILKYRLMDANVALTRIGVFVSVYVLVLGVPFGVMIWARHFIERLGYYGMLLPLLLGVSLASGGPFIYLFLQRRAESRLLAQKRQRQGKLRELSSYMMRFTRLSTLAGLIVHNVLKILQLKHVALYLLEADNNKPKQYNLIAEYAVPSRDGLPKNIALDSVLAKALTQQKVFIEREEIKHKAASTINHNLSFLEQELIQFKANIIIPAFLRSNLMGFLILGESKSNETFTQEDINVLQVLSNQAALAIENALFWQRDEEKLVESSKEEAASAVSFGAGHQFNNRLYAMSMMVDGIFDTLGERDVEHMTQEEIRPLFKKTLGKLKKISEECQFGGQITAGIMSLTGTTPPNFEEFDISVIINSSIELVEMKHSRDKIEGNRPAVLIINHALKALPLIFGSDAQIRDCLFNLIDNAYDAAYEKDTKIKKEDPELHWPQGQAYNPQIEVKASVKDNHLVIDITDNGIGVQEEDKKRIFVGFFTTKATSVKGYGPGGHGIGVFTVKKLILAHKGKISFNSEYGKGTTFTIELPLLKKGNNSHA